jgi:putative ABC transport system ATP-binding protein
MPAAPRPECSPTPAAEPGPGPVLVAERLTKVHGGTGAEVHALRGVDFSVEAGSFVAIMGPSGSGKSTLLNLLGGLDEPTAGEVRIGGTCLAGLGDDELTRLRAAEVGFVFQFFALLGTLTAAENVALPAIIAGRPAAEAAARADELLARVGLPGVGHRKPGQLSGGQQQRVAIARALAAAPRVLLADEPTGALDTDSGNEVLGVLRELADRGETVVLVTHDPHVAARADRIVFLRDGRVVLERPGGDAVEVAATLTELRVAAPSV